MRVHGVAVRSVALPRSPLLQSSSKPDLQKLFPFLWKARGDNHYLALRIAGRYGSVLNSAANWAGSYAFHNGLIDYEIMENGDMVMFWHSLAPDGAGYPGTGGSLDLVTYKASGWTSYPATPAFGDKYSVGHDHGDSPITGARIVFRNAANGKDPTNLVMAFSQNGVITVLNTPKGIAHPAVIGSFPGDTVGLDSNDEGHVCVAYHRGGNAVQVSCLAPGSSEWKHLGAALSGSSPGQRLRPEVVVTKTKVFALGRSDSAENTILAASCLLESAGEEWAPASYPALGIVSYFQATGNSDTVFLAVAEGNGEGLRVVQTSG